MWGPWRAEPPSETVVMFCKLCWGSGNICVLCVWVADGGLGMSLQQLVHLHGTWHTVRLREVCWVQQNGKYSRLKTFKVPDHVRVCVCVCVCVCICLCVCVCVCVWSTYWYNLLYFWIQKICYRLLCFNKHREFGTGCCIIWNTDSYAFYHTVAVYISDASSAAALALYWVLPANTIGFHYWNILIFCR